MKTPKHLANYIVLIGLLLFFVFLIGSYYWNGSVVVEEGFFNNNFGKRIRMDDNPIAPATIPTTGTPIPTTTTPMLATAPLMPTTGPTPPTAYNMVKKLMNAKAQVDVATNNLADASYNLAKATNYFVNATNELAGDSKNLTDATNYFAYATNNLADATNDFADARLEYESFLAANSFTKVPELDRSPNTISALPTTMAKPTQDKNVVLVN